MGSLLEMRSNLFFLHLLLIVVIGLASCSPSAETEAEGEVRAAQEKILALMLRYQAGDLEGEIDFFAELWSLPDIPAENAVVPLLSNFEEALRKWRHERAELSGAAMTAVANAESDAQVMAILEEFSDSAERVHSELEPDAKAEALIELLKAELADD